MVTNVAPAKGTLKLNRRPGEEVIIGEKICITRTADGWQLRDGDLEVSLHNGSPGKAACIVQAPREISVRRGELPKQAA